MSGARNGETAGKKWFTVQKNVEETETVMLNLFQHLNFKVPEIIPNYRDRVTQVNEETKTNTRRSA
ncbi:hypothetical protein GCM10011340_35440 [Roseivirga thermotolerans]|uniref:Uncharacterized protein n=1 Tax=Roseivirga thermotolerans TaxID=1758176 RepID=A0ABQ3IA30_9BACT|nr:hypothetical protein GCM10011340_35440 [Roseivirga thermotolerans]